MPKEEVAVFIYLFLSIFDSQVEIICSQSLSSLLGVKSSWAEPCQSALSWAIGAKPAAGRAAGIRQGFFQRRTASDSNIRVIDWHASMLSGRFSSESEFHLVAGQALPGNDRDSAPLGGQRTEAIEVRKKGQVAYLFVTERDIQVTEGAVPVWG
ncbi:MAG: hypothetical protein ACR65R_01760 [Methylomicrobium sp.]